MHNQQSYQTTINLKDLLFSVLYRWRSVLLVTLACCVAFVGVQTFFGGTGSVETADKKVAYEAELQTYEDSVAYFQQVIGTNEEAAQRLTDYYAASPMMSLDPQNVWTAARQYMIRVDDSFYQSGYIIDPVDFLLPYFTTLFSSDAAAEDLQAAFGTDQMTYVAELATVNANTANNTITVTLWAATREQLQTQLDWVDRRISEISQGQAAGLYAHTVVLVQESVTSGADKNLLTAQDSANAEIVKYKKEVNNAQTSLGKLKKPTMPQQLRVAQRSLRTSVMLGLLIGLCLCLLWHVLTYILRGRLHTAAEFRGRYGTPVFGDVPQTRARHSGKGLDGLIEKLEYGRTGVNPDVVYDRVAALLKEQKPEGDVLLTGTLTAQDAQPALDQLSSRLKGDVKLRFQPDLLLNSAAVAEAGKAAAVLVVEKKNVSLTRDIGREAEILSIGETPVIGAVLL